MKLKLLETMHDRGKLIWKEGHLYDVTYDGTDVYYVATEIGENYGIEKKAVGKRYEIVMEEGEVASDSNAKKVD